MMGRTPIIQRQSAGAADWPQLSDDLMPRRWNHPLETRG